MSTFGHLEVRHSNDTVGPLANRRVLVDVQYADSCPRQLPVPAARMPVACLAVTTIVRAYGPRDAQPTWDAYLRAVRDTASADYAPEQVVAWAPDSTDLAAWNERRLSAYTFVATFERFGFVVDRANAENWIRGQNLPNCDMHLDLG